MSFCIGPHTYRTYWNTGQRDTSTKLLITVDACRFFSQFLSDANHVLYVQKKMQVTAILGKLRDEMSSK